MDLSRAAAAALDASVPLAHWRDRFVVDDPDVLYLDGNSLGRLPRGTVDRLRRVATEGWGRGLVRSWEGWLDLPLRTGDRIGAIVGAAPGQVAVADSTTVNLYKLAAAALDARPGRRAVVTDVDNFPTDRYVVEGLAAERGLEIRWIQGDPVTGPAVDDVTAMLTATSRWSPCPMWPTDRARSRTWPPSPTRRTVRAR